MPELAGEVERSKCLHLVGTIVPFSASKRVLVVLMRTLFLALLLQDEAAGCIPASVGIHVDWKCWIPLEHGDGNFLLYTYECKLLGLLPSLVDLAHNTRKWSPGLDIAFDQVSDSMYNA